MQQRDSEYCEFRELSARVMTWNAGAVKPTTLRQSGDRDFLRDIIEPENPPDVLVFGFQELVDLENKKITAKSFFKKKKQKENSEHEHMSHQYRAWKDHLVRVLDDHAPRESSMSSSTLPISLACSLACSSSLRSATTFAT